MKVLDDPIIARALAVRVPFEGKPVSLAFILLMAKQVVPVAGGIRKVVKISPFFGEIERCVIVPVRLVTDALADLKVVGMFQILLLMHRGSRLRRSPGR